METPALEPRSTRIVLDVDSEAQPIHGFVRTESGEAEPFDGWLELTRALERLISEAARPPAPAPGPPAT